VSGKAKKFPPSDTNPPDLWRCGSNELFKKGWTWPAAWLVATSAQCPAWVIRDRVVALASGSTAAVPASFFIRG